MAPLLTKRHGYYFALSGGPVGIEAESGEVPTMDSTGVAPDPGQGIADYATCVTLKRVLKCRCVVAREAAHRQSRRPKPWP